MRTWLLLLAGWLGGCLGTPRGAGELAPVVIGSDGSVRVECTGLSLAREEERRLLERYFALWRRERAEEELLVLAENGAPGAALIAVKELLAEAGVEQYRVAKGQVLPGR